MKSFIVVCLALSCAILAAADINDVKNTAIKNMALQVNLITNLANTTAMEIENRESSANKTAAQTRKFGEGIHANSVFEISGHSIWAFAMARLLRFDRDQYLCIEKRVLGAQVGNNRAFTISYLTRSEEMTKKAEEIERSLIGKWINDTKAGFEKFFTAHKKAVEDVKNCKSETKIHSIVKEFMTRTLNFSDAITSIYTKLTEADIKVLNTFDQILCEYLEIARTTIDDGARQIRECIPNENEKMNSSSRASLFKTENLNKRIPDLFQTARLLKTSAR